MLRSRRAWRGRHRPAEACDGATAAGAPRREATRAAGDEGLGEQSEGAREPHYVALAADALLAGLTREGVVAALTDRIERDAHSLAYRKACRRQRRYDEQVTADLRAIALAICWLSEPARGHVE